ncbi:hypothetical protein ACFQO7_31375 [Catellatospora aurea]|uniref:Uncharacterized protein n=1 Tax=Catellatospora aurea TaxID=1337874 RepID=A0ABW2H5F9_9ACTN
MSEPQPTDEAAAAHAVRTHCAIDYPNGSRCLNCHARYPCDIRLAAVEILVAAAWQDEAIMALDARTGPWF